MTESVQHSACRGALIGAMSLVVMYLIWFGYIARLSQWGGMEGGLFFAKSISTCLHGGYRRGSMETAPCVIDE